MTNIKPYLFLVLSITLLSLNFFNIHLQKLSEYDKKENFDPGLLRLNSIDKLTAFIDSTAHLRNINQPDTAYFQIANDVMQLRFFHGYSSYSLSENWVSAFADKFISNGVDCIVKPADIIKYPMAACSQQAIVLAEVARKKNVLYRKILFGHHYCMELFIDNKWFFYDTNMEPRLNDTNRGDSILENLSKLRAFYPEKYSHELLNHTINEVQRGKPNEPLAANAILFHTATSFLSKFAWAVPFLFFLFTFKLNPQKENLNTENREKFIVSTS